MRLPIGPLSHNKEIDMDSLLNFAYFIHNNDGTFNKYIVEFTYIYYSINL